MDFYYIIKIININQVEILKIFADYELDENNYKRISIWDINQSYKNYISTKNQARICLQINSSFTSSELSSIPKNSANVGVFENHKASL